MNDGLAAAKYTRIIRAVRAMPWAIQPDSLLRIMDVLAFQAEGCKLTPEEIRAHVGTPRAATPRASQSGAVAVLRLSGIISHRIEQVDDISGPGGTSVEGFRRRFDTAMADASVGSIVIDVDSPGGGVDGVPELAAHIRAARGTKPVLAVANTLAASAAYWIASAADEISVAPSGEVGSVGVFAAHTDLSEQMAMMGERVTLVHAGKYKIEGNPFEPLSDEGRAHIQGLVDAVYEDFIAAVAAGRGTTAANVRQTYGEGRVVRASDALAKGMVDRIETLDEATGRLRGTARSSSNPGRRGDAPRSPRAFAFL